MKTENGSNANGNNPENPVNPVLSLGTENLRKSAKSVDSSSLPNSKKIYIGGTIYPEIRVPFREISLSPTKTISGEIEVNEPVRVYDTSGPWGDTSVTLDPVQGLPPLRQNWILKRGDVEEIQGRAVTPIDDGFLSEKHRANAGSRNGNSKSESRSSKQIRNSKLSTLNPQLSALRKPLRAKPGNAVTQLAYARRGIITPEMEFIALRENMGRAAAQKSQVSP